MTNIQYIHPSKAQFTTNGLPVVSWCIDFLTGEGMYYEGMSTVCGNSKVSVRMYAMRQTDGMTVYYTTYGLRTTALRFYMNKCVEFRNNFLDRTTKPTHIGDATTPQTERTES